MTYFKLHLKRIVFIVIVWVMIFFSYVLIISFIEIPNGFGISPDFLLLGVSLMLLVDSLVIMYNKGDLFSDNYKGTASYCSFKFFLYFDIIVGTPLFFYSTVDILVHGLIVPT